MMSWVTVIWSMIAAACLTLAAMYFAVWWKNRTARAQLLFSLTATLTAVFAFCELWLMQTQTPQELDVALRWIQLPLSLWLVSLTWFVSTYLDSGRRWLAWTICGLRALFVLPNLLMGGNAHLREIPSLQRVPLLGESVTVVAGVPNPWSLLGPLSALLILAFVADASVTAWRRGARRRAMVVGGTVGFFLLTGSSMALLVVWAGLKAPQPLSLYFLGVIGMMGYELSRDVLRASQLVHELQVSEAGLRATEAGLRESEARMSLALDAGEFGLWTWDLERNEIWASPKWRELFFFPPCERPEFSDILKRLHPDDRDGLERVHSRAVANVNGGRYHMEYRLLPPDGSTRWISSLGRVETDATGQPVLIRGVSREVTARKRSEQEAQILRDEIAHAGRVSMMGHLASGLAHEINQPLAAILRNAEAAEMFLQHPSPDLDEIRAILADIRSDDERAAQVIDRMRRLLQRHTLDTRRLDVSSLVGDVAALLRVDAAAREVKLEVGVPGDVPYVRGDRVHIQQVLLNLIINGMDALNGATLEERRVGVSARVNAVSGAPIVEIRVDDAGPGIPADRLPQIFDPFFTTKPNGMGMGLAISRTIIEAHGGQIWAENKTGGGAAFRFTLPVADEASAQ